MLLPNKIVPYEKSVIFFFPVILKVMKKHKVITPLALFNAVKKELPDVSTFIDVLDCLYAIGKISLDEDRGILKYVV